MNPDKKVRFLGQTPNRYVSTVILSACFCNIVFTSATLVVLAFLSICHH